MPLRRDHRHIAQYGGHSSAAPAPPAFDPATVSGLTAWYNADNIVGSDGDAITTWEDDVASLDITQATVSAKPKLKKAANGINNKNVVLFATDDVLSTSSNLTLAQPLTIATVVRHTTGSVAGSEAVTGAGDFTPYLFVANGAPDGYAMYAGTTATATTFSLDGNAHIVVAIFAGASSHLWIDGTEHALSANPGAGGYATEIMHVGAGNGPTEFFNGSIAQLQIINGAISASDRDGLETTWGSAYSITVA